MSASREKKQRQGAGPSEKALQAQQQQAAQKRKTITYTVIGVVIAVLIAALLIWNSGFFQARATAVTVGDTSLTTAELSYYYYNARSQYVYMASMLGSFDSSIPDDEQIFNAEENTTLRDYFMETALTNAQQYHYLSEEALKNGHTEADVKADLDAQIASTKAEAASYSYSYAAYLRAQYGPYMTASIFEKETTRFLLARLAYNEKLTEFSDSYTEDDLKAYYNEDDNADTLDTFEYSYLYFTPADVDTKDEDGNDIDEETVNTQKELALAEAKAKADEALEALEDGGKVSDLVKKYSLADNAYADHTTTVGKSSISSLYQEQLLALKEGESTLVENGTSGYYVITFHGRSLVQDPTKDVRHILAIAETSTNEESKTVVTDEAWAAAKEKIDAIQAEWEAGDKTEDSFAALANEKSDDGNGTTGGLYPKIDIGDSYYYVSEFLDWIFTDGRKAGDTGIIQHDAGEGSSEYSGYHFMYLVGDNEPLWMRSTRSTLASQAASDWMDELAESYPTVLANGANYLGR